MDPYDYNDLDMSLDITPLIDVLFILLLFFILTASFARPVLKGNLPKADNATRQELNKEDIIVHVDAEGSFSYNEEILAVSELEAFFLNLPTTGALVFQVDEDARFADFVLLLDAAKGGGRDDFVIQTTNP